MAKKKTPAPPASAAPGPEWASELEDGPGVLVVRQPVLAHSDYPGGLLDAPWFLIAGERRVRAARLVGLGVCSSCAESTEDAEEKLAEELVA